MKTIYLVRHGEGANNVITYPTYVANEAKLTDIGKDEAATIASFCLVMTDFKRRPLTSADRLGAK